MPLKSASIRSQRKRESFWHTPISSWKWTPSPFSSHSKFSRFPFLSFQNWISNCGDIMEMPTRPALFSPFCSHFQNPPSEKNIKYDDKGNCFLLLLSLHGRRRKGKSLLLLRTSLRSVFCAGPCLPKPFRKRKKKGTWQCHFSAFSLFLPCPLLFYSSRSRAILPPKNDSHLEQGERKE